MARIPWQEMAESLGYPDKDTMLIEMYKTMGYVAIANKLGVERNSIKSRLMILGIPPHPPGGCNNLRHGRYCGEHARRYPNGRSRRRNSNQSSNLTSVFIADQY